MKMAIVISKCYNSQHLPILINTLPQGWNPQAVIIDGMFLINCKPLRHTSTVAEYATLLFNHFISPHYQAGATEVHLVCDTPSKQPFSPKCYECKRDQSHRSTNHNHLSFTPQSWSSLRTVKTALNLLFITQKHARILH